ncbi:hypothetical protein B0T14DRAFT_543178 [Immersiella caudata]|uniref:Nephrocystin 3-like N-terminal domain-containing protein n=1 Tax=Immersiella caudata TaxID=314043 RepID=A0AA40C689_9PEZI|nr:hypothetical protein B0T14DRAFT_543178 [Immersiella caudata]
MGQRSCSHWQCRGISKVDYRSQQNDHISRWQPGTGLWLLETTEFDTWTNGSAQTLLCPGFPGAGKMILTSIVVENLASQFKDNKDVGIAYIYCNLRRQMEQDATRILAAIFRQLIQNRPDLVKMMGSLFEKHDSEKTSLSFIEISQSPRTLTMSSKSFIIFTLWMNWQASCGVNVFFTSRLIPEITNQLAQFPFVEVRASSEDVQKYIEANLSILRPGYQKKFLLAHIYLDSLGEKYTVSGVRRALTQLPRKKRRPSEDSRLEALDQAYDEALERIIGRDNRCENWPRKSPAELDPDNIPSVEDMVSVRAGLVTVDEESSIVRLTHYTTQEYFEQSNSWFPGAHAYILGNCITYLSFDVFGRRFTSWDEVRQLQREYPLLRYAAENWGYYVPATPLNDTHPVISFLKSSQVSLAGVLAVGSHTKGMHLAAYFGLDHALMTLIEQGLNPDLKSGRGQTPLSLADNRVDPNSSDCSRVAPLTWAARHGHEEIIKLLLARDDKGADPNAKDNNDCTPDNIGRTPISWAAGEYRGADPSFGDFTGRTPLSWAMGNDKQYAAKALLENGADAARVDQDGRSPLDWAIRNGHSAMKIELN